MSQFKTLPAASVTASNPSIGTNGTTAPTSATEVAGVNPSGNLMPLQVDSSGNLEVNVTTGSITANNAANGVTGAAVPVDATQVAGVNPSGNLQALKLDSSGNLLVDISSPVIANNNITEFGSNPVVTGTGASGLGIPRVTISNDSSVLVSSLPSIPAGSNAIGSVSVSNFPATQAISGSVSVSNFPATQAISATSLPLPTGAATSANQATEISSLATIAANTTNAGTPVVSGTVAVSSLPSLPSGSNAIGSVAVSSSALPTGASTSANQITEIGYLSTIATNTGTGSSDFQTTGTITALNGTVSQTGQGVYTTSLSITGTWSATLVVEGQTPDLNWYALPINVSANELPFYQQQTITTNGLYLITGGGFLNIRVRASAYTSGTVSVAMEGSLSQQTVIANINTPDLYLVGAATQTATVNNILPNTTSSSAATVALGFKSASVQVVSTGTAGTYIFEGSNDNINFTTITSYNAVVLTGTPVTAAVTASIGTIVYIFPINHAYIRLRIATTITGGSIQAFTKLSQVAFSAPVVQVAQNTAANLLTTATISSGTVTTVSTVTANNTATPGSVADVASAAITTTTTTAAFTPTNGSSYMINIPVTAVTGTTPTLSVAVQESADAGTNWYTTYTFPTITTTGSYNSPVITLTGNRVRYVQTVGGTTPSFTRAISRLQSSQPNFSQPATTTYTDRSGTTSATPSTSTQVAAYNQTRRYFIIQNLSSTASVYINFTSAATAGSGSLYLGPFGSYVMESGTITSEAINIISSTASVPFSAKEG